MKKVTMLENGTRVEIDGGSVKHFGADGNVLYDSEKMKKRLLSKATENNGDGLNSSLQTKATIPNFCYIGKNEREVISKWLEGAKPTTKRQNSFIVRVNRALRIKYDFQISMTRPSFDEKGDICYKDGNDEIASGISSTEWKAKANMFYNSTKWHSELASLREGDLLKAYLVARGIETLESVCCDDKVQEIYLSPKDKAYKYKNGSGQAYEIYSLGGQFVFNDACFYEKDVEQSDADFVYDTCPQSLNDGYGVVVLIRNAIY